jgi:hypothetical protein
MLNKSSDVVNPLSTSFNLLFQLQQRREPLLVAIIVYRFIAMNIPVRR